MFEWCYSSSILLFMTTTRRITFGCPIAVIIRAHERARAEDTSLVQTSLLYDMFVYILIHRLAIFLENRRSREENFMMHRMQFDDAPLLLKSTVYMQIIGEHRSVIFCFSLSALFIDSMSRFTCYTLHLPVSSSSLSRSLTWHTSFGFWCNHFSIFINQAYCS